MYKNLRPFTVSVLLMSGIIAGCESLPKNVGMASSSSEIGVVYSAKIKAIYPIFVKPDTDHSSSDGVGVLAEALTERVFGYSSAVGSLASASGQFASAATGMYEERYAGLYCHYILEVDGSDLLNELGIDDDDDDDDDRSSSRSRSRSFSRSTSSSRTDFEDDEDDGRRSRSTNNNRNTDFEDEDRNSSRRSNNRNQSSRDNFTRRSSVSRTVERRVEYRMDDLWGRLEETLGDWQGVTSVQASPASPTTKRIFVVNPCRNFRLGSKVTISKGDETVILQPSF